MRQASDHGARTCGVEAAGGARRRVSCELRGASARCGSLLGARVGREHSKLQNKQCVAKNGRRPETMQSRAEQCLAESVKLCLPAGSVTLLGEW